MVFCLGTINPPPLMFPLKLKSVIPSDVAFLSTTCFKLEHDRLDVTIIELPPGWTAHSVGSSILFKDQRDQIRAHITNSILSPWYAFRLREDTSNHWWNAVCQSNKFPNFFHRENTRERLENYLNQHYSYWNDPTAYWD